jgi:hypothetical protein
LHNLAETLAAAHKGGAAALVEHEIDGAAAVEVDKVDVCFLAQQFGALGHEDGVLATKLHAENVLALVATKERPLAGQAL